MKIFARLGLCPLARRQRSRVAGIARSCVLILAQSRFEPFFLTYLYEAISRPLFSSSRHAAVRLRARATSLAKSIRSVHTVFRFAETGCLRAGRLNPRRASLPSPCL